DAVRCTPSGCASRSMRCCWIGTSGCWQSSGCRPVGCSCRGPRSVRSWRSPPAAASRSVPELPTEVPLAMVLATPVLGEPHREDAVVLDPDRVCDVPGEHVPMHERQVALDREDLGCHLNVLLDPGRPAPHDLL